MEHSCNGQLSTGLCHLPRRRWNHVFENRGRCSGTRDGLLALYCEDANT